MMNELKLLLLSSFDTVLLLQIASAITDGLNITIAVIGINGLIIMDGVIYICYYYFSLWINNTFMYMRT